MSKNPTMASAVSSPVVRRVLLVDDEPLVLRAYDRFLGARGLKVDTADTVQVALMRLRENTYDVVVSDVAMPGATGLELLVSIQVADPDLPVILMSGGPNVEDASAALELGALRYLSKPLDAAKLDAALEAAFLRRDETHEKRVALAESHDRTRVANELQSTFDDALGMLFLVYQPIIDWDRKRVYAHEALLRSRHPTLSNPGVLLDAAEKLNRAKDIGTSVRSKSGAPLAAAPADSLLFVNLHSDELNDEALYSPDAPLSQIASRVVLEITERAALGSSEEARKRVATLRSLGFRIAIDDLGAGYAGLSSLAILEPDVVKIDMSLVRDCDREPTKRKLVQSIVTLCAGLGQVVIAEGVETVAERDVLVDLGCNYLQGYLFAKPALPFPEIRWG